MAYSKELQQKIKQLQEDFEVDEIEYLGYNRFLFRFYNTRTFDSMFSKDAKHCQLRDGEGNLILLQEQYDDIFIYTRGVAVVSKRSAKSENESVYVDGQYRKILSRNKKFGLIDIEGKELLPCIYDQISPKLDGYIEIIKAGLRKATSIPVLTGGKFNWDDAQQAV